MKILKHPRCSSRTKEDGNILILGLGYIVVVLILVLLLVHIGAQYLERKRWQGVADGAALVLSDARVVHAYVLSLSNNGSWKQNDHQIKQSEDPEVAAKRFVESARLIKGLPAPHDVKVSAEGEPAAVSLMARGNGVGVWMLGAQASQTAEFRVRSQALNSHNVP